MAKRNEPTITLPLSLTRDEVLETVNRVWPAAALQGELPLDDQGAPVAKECIECGESAHYLSSPTDDLDDATREAIGVLVDELNRHGVTFADAARRLGYKSESTVTNWAHGHAVPKGSSFARLCGLISQLRGELYGFDDYPTLCVRVVLFAVVNGYQNERLAVVFGRDASTISAWMRGQRAPTDADADLVRRITPEIE